MPIPEEIALYNAGHELTDHLVYGRLALAERDAANRELLEKLAAQEKAHCAFWTELAPAGKKPEPDSLSLSLTPVLRRVMGVTFTIKLLERHEKETISLYEKTLAPLMPPSHSERFAAIIDEERNHARELVGRIKDRRVEYVGFIALGLSDAIVELTGVNAGFLGATGSTRAAGLSSLIVGFAAAISMASAAYMQAKQNEQGAALSASAATGATYLLAVILLALPYFLLSGMVPAFLASTGVGMLLLGALTFYSAVVFERGFLREFAEAAVLMLGTAGATYALGAVISRFFRVALPG